MSLRDGCCGFFGDLFGHSFRTVDVERHPIATAEIRQVFELTKNDTAYWDADDIQNLIDSMAEVKKVVVCTRCGATQE